MLTRRYFACLWAFLGQVLLCAAGITAEPDTTSISGTIEDRDGNPIRVDTDLLGRKRQQPTAGPIANSKAGTSIIRWAKSVGPR